jgi:acylphosphatase
MLVVCSVAMGAEEGKVVRRHWFVSGKVQGVGFRAFTFDAARELKVRGWVRNLTDLRVEVVAEGPERAVDALLAKVKVGPVGAKVGRVADAKVDEAERLGAEFEIRDTAEAPK